MEPFGIGIAGLSAAALASLGAFGLAFRQRRRRLAARPRTPADRLEALAQAQAELGLRLDALGAQAAAPEERLQAMAGQLLALIRDKNATLETALAGLDQLRARMRTLEQMGEPAEARALLATLGGRIDELQAAQAAATAGLEARLAALAPGGVAELAERLARLHETRDAGLEAVLARFGPLETRLAGAEGGREALKRAEARLEALQGESSAARSELAALKAASGAGSALAEQLARLHAQKEALAEALVGRVAAVEAAVAARDPQALAGVEAGLAALRDRLGALEGGTPLTELAEQLTRLHAQKDAGIAAVLTRLQPLEARLAEMERGLAARDPQAALDRFADRLEAVQGRLAAIEDKSPFAELTEQLSGLHAQRGATAEAVFARLAPLETKLATLEAEARERDPQAALADVEARLAALRDRLGALEGGTPLTELAEQLARLHAQKDATVETVFARLAPLEARLAALELADPRALLDRFAERLEAAQGRLAALEDKTPFAELTEQLTGLYAQKDATVETVFARLGPLEAKLAALELADPRALLDRFAERLEAVQGRLAALEDKTPFAELTEQLTGLYAQKDATTETVFARLAPLEARLAALELADPRALLDRFAERLEAAQGRLAALEDKTPFAELTEQLTGLYAQKDATVETVFARLGPLEAKLAALELADPRALLDRFAERLEAVQGRLAALEDKTPFAELTEQLTGLYAQKDATVETVFARLAPLEARLAALELADPRALLDRFAERLEAAQGRLAALEDKTPFAELTEQLTGLYAQKDATVETVFARLGPLEAKLAALELADPRALLDRFAERLEAVQGRLAALEDKTPFAELTEQLTGLYAQKDATVEAVFARLAPLEAKLAALEGGLARVLPLADDDPRAAVEGLRARIEALHWAQGEVAAGLAALQAVGAEGGALAGVADQLTRLFAQKDAGAVALLARLQPLEVRLAELEARPWDPEADAARAEASAIAAQLIAVQAAAEQTALFADRISELEASLPRLSAAQVQAVAAGEAAPSAAPNPAELEAIWTLPRIVSLHQK